MVTSFLPTDPLFGELQYKFAVDNISKTGFDILFYGQEHYDTLAILSKKEDIPYDKVTENLAKQRLLSNKDLLIRNFEELIYNLKECENYIDNVLAGKESGDPEVGR